MTAPKPKVEPKPEPAPARLSVDLDIGTANFGRGHTDTYRAQNIEKWRHAQARGFVTCLQEIDEADGKPNSDGPKGDEHLDLRRSMPNYTWAQFASHEPIGVPQGWTIVSTWSVKGHAGMAGYSPYRPINIAVLRHDDTGIEISVVNTHPVRLGPSGGRLAERQELWDEWFANVKDVIANQHETGRPVFFTADANEPNMGKLHPDQKVFVHNGLDYIIGIDGADIEIVKKSVSHVDLTIDGHNGHIADLRLERA